MRLLMLQEHLLIWQRALLCWAPFSHACPACGAVSEQGPGCYGHCVGGMRVQA